MVDLSLAGTAVNGVSTLSGIILVTPNVDKGILPQTTSGATVPIQKPTSFFFHYNAEKTVTLESDITDHYAEDNTARQDQIALKPELLGMAGYIAELSDFLQPGSAQAILQQATDKLVSLAPFTPQISLAALIAYNTAAQLYTTAANAVAAVQSTLGAFGVGSPAQNKQQTAYLFFRKAYLFRTLFTVQTPWEIYKDVAIKMVKATEEESTTGWTGFQVQFKQMTFTSTAMGAIGSANMQGRLAAAASPEVNSGTTSGVPGPDLASQMTASGYA
jgi:hypothetical protein